MTFEVEIHGETTTVAIEPVGAAGPHGGTFRVALSGTAGAGARTSHEIQAARTDLGLSLLFASDHRSVDVAMTPRTAGECLVQTPRLTVAATYVHFEPGSVTRQAGGRSGEFFATWLQYRF